MGRGAEGKDGHPEAGVTAEREGKGKAGRPGRAFWGGASAPRTHLAAPHEVAVVEVVEEVDARTPRLRVGGQRSRRTHSHAAERGGEHMRGRSVAANSCGAERGANEFRGVPRRSERCKGGRRCAKEVEVRRSARCQRVARCQVPMGSSGAQRAAHVDVVR
eukprot:4935225-Prymnesium_polylepis.1